MQPDLFTTQDLPPARQYDAWRERFWPVLDIHGQEDAEAGFVAENCVWNLERIALSRVSAPPVRVVRERSHVRRDHVDHWVLACCRSGATRAATDRGTIQVPAGVPFLWSMGMNFASERTQVDRVQVYLPRELFHDIAGQFDAASGSVIDTPLGRLLGDHLFAMERRLPTMTAADRPWLAATLRSMVAACVAPSADRLAAAGGVILDSRKERVRQAIRANLRSPTLGPKKLCRLVGVSRSNLYRLFEDCGGVATYIQRQRLHEAHRALADGSDRRSIAAIAEDLCFADSSGFSRAFRQFFGCSPSDVRAAAQAGAAPPPTMQQAARQDSERFADLLRLA